MAAPFANEDLEKLKKFIEFVSSNPLILNMPQLAFVKKFIEQFGGTVPAGDFQMPAGGGKCPFGGDVKSESKPTSESQEVPEDMEEEEDDESEVSDLELEMEETIVPFVEPNVVYLDVKPPKIIKYKRSTSTTKKTRRKKCPNVQKKRLSSSPLPPQPTNKTKNLILPSPSHDDVVIKKESESDELDGDDPLFTPIIKIEIEEEKEVDFKMDNKTLEETNTTSSICEEDYKSEISENDEENEKISKRIFERNNHKERKYFENEDSDVDEDSNEDINYDKEEEDDDEEEEDEEDDEEDDYECNEDDVDDELLIRLTKKKKAKVPRSVKCYDTCKQKCSLKLSEDHRLRTCEYFWSLTKVQRVQYIRTHTKQRRFTRIKMVRLNSTPVRNNHCCYFLDSECGCKSSELIRVCRKYFETTLCITSYTIQKALDGYTPEPVDDFKPLTAEEKEERRKAIQKAINEKKLLEIKEILDPETGVLHVVDPKEKKPKSPKKYKRRKPGDPMPLKDPKPVNCEVRCIYKCHLIFTAQERKNICHSFWSMDYKSRKEFILAHIETKDVRSQVNPEYRLSNRPPRTYQTRFYLKTSTDGERKRVCKNFMMATLSITRHFISNALEFLDKTTGTYVGSDGRGKASPKARIIPEYYQRMKDHINTYPTWVPNSESKKRYLHNSLTIKLMYKDYEDLSRLQGKKAGPINTYYKIFHNEFDLSFLCCPERKRGIGLVLLNPNISQYIGNEPGGYWLHPSGEKLDINRPLGSSDLGLLGRSFLPPVPIPPPPPPSRSDEGKRFALSPAGTSSTTAAVDFSTTSSTFGDWQFSATTDTS